MKTKISIIRNLTVTVLLACVSNNALAESETQRQFSGINQVTFNNEEYNNPFAGNGFLISYQNKLFAVTVKHALLEAKTPTLTSVYLQDELKEWRIHPNKTADKYVRLGKLLNADKSEAIDMKILSKDWLLFEVKENHSELTVLNLRDKPLKVGEAVTAYGCSYANKLTCVQDTYNGNFLAKETNNLRISMPDLDLGKLRGLSGSPVLDEQNKVVGIVSNILKRESGEGFDFAPASLDYLRAILDKNLS